MAHAYFITGEIEGGIASAAAFLESEHGLVALANPDVMTLRHGLLSVDDARRLRSLAELAPTKGEQKALIISASRLFHEAQNALLKLFEEPPAGTLLILVIPSEGMLLPTLRSRLLALPSSSSNEVPTISIEAQEFLKSNSAEREKMMTKIVDRSKSDKDEEKQNARLSAIHLMEGLERAAYAKWNSDRGDTALRLFLDDTDHFLPILHERSAPLKLIFEHILLTLPVAI